VRAPSWRRPASSAPWIRPSGCDRQRLRSPAAAIASGCVACCTHGQASSGGGTRATWHACPTSKLPWVKLGPCCTVQTTNKSPIAIACDTSRNAECTPWPSLCCIDDCRLLARCCGTTAFAVPVLGSQAHERFARGRRDSRPCVAPKITARGRSWQALGGNARPSQSSAALRNTYSLYLHVCVFGGGRACIDQAPSPRPCTRTRRPSVLEYLQP
jgi:hypothetical protein